MTAILAPHPGTRCKPPWHRRALASLRAIRRRRAVEEARDDAYLVRIEPHAVPPMAQAQAQLTALFGALHHEHAGFGQPPADAFNQPPAAVQPDRDVPGMEHLASGQYGDWATGQFRAVARGWEE